MQCHLGSFTNSINQVHPGTFYRREALRQTIVNDAAKEAASRKKGKCRCTKTNHKKKKKKQLYNAGGEGKCCRQW